MDGRAMRPARHCMHNVWGYNGGMQWSACVRFLEHPERVDIQCVECLLFGSSAVEQLRLNDRVHFSVHTVFTCQRGQSTLLPTWCCLLRVV